MHFTASFDTGHVGDTSNARTILAFWAGQAQREDASATALKIILSVDALPGASTPSEDTARGEASRA